ncbi:MAG: metallophosphoesterase [Beutenbergiaceae bacterium]
MIRGTGLLAGAAAAGLAWALIEAQAFVLRRVQVPALVPGANPIRVLHLSDLHMTPNQHRKAQWVRSLAQERPDLVVNTGDNLAHPEALPLVLHALEPYLDLPGAFALGSNDYFGPTRRNPARYLLPDSRTVDSHRGAPDLPGRELQQQLTAHGWADLANARSQLVVAGQTVSFVGMADAHMDLDVLPPGSIRPLDAVAHLGVTHAPYQRVLNRFLGDDCDLVLAGHTHGGQLCIPGLGALTTNCDLDVAYAKGLHRWPTQEPASRSLWLHVSAGLGTNPYTPVRFACRPEATLLTLVPGA